jgi:hypothetical protein
MKVRELIRIHHLALIIVLSVTVVTLISGWVYVLLYRSERLSYTPDTEDHVEVDYWKTKGEIATEMQGYINKKVPYNDLDALLILKYCDEYDIDPRLPLAQGLVESHYGTSGLARKTNSVWNMGAYDRTTLDRISGVYKYAHPNQSIEPYLRNLHDNFLGDEKTEQDLLRAFVNLNGKRYASAGRKVYEREIGQVWTEIDTTTHLDSLLNVYYKIKLELK